MNLCNSSPSQKSDYSTKLYIQSEGSIYLDINI